ncbi:Uncharacterised protein [Actinomyces howellii]|uniref:SatD family (SatD) n=1 Tax=Actinomyces howellii TaxID=52771 RepID=A0A3S4T8M6_9ACTO|nr:Uncharacterised protein [Actinomyces howellii]
MYALIADIVGSRRLPDRARAQESVTAALEQARLGLSMSQDPYATVGDEFQAVAVDLAGALTLTLRTHLLLPDGLALRFGVGAGEVSALSPGAGAPIQDGSAWWAAREAIDLAHGLQERGRSFARTWLRVADGAGTLVDPTPTAQGEAVANAMLLLRDQAVSRMRARQRRVLAGLLMGATQVEVARRERLSQQAVSEFVRGPGAAVLEAQSLVDGLAVPDP